MFESIIVLVYLNIEYLVLIFVQCRLYYIAQFLMYCFDCFRVYLYSCVIHQTAHIVNKSI